MTRLLALLLACSQESAPDTLAAPAGMRFSSALLCDLDLDGRLDLVAALASAGGRAQERRLEVHLQRATAPAFVPEPDGSLGLGADVTVFAAGDFHADPGREVLLCNAGGVFLWRPRVSKEGRLLRVLQADVLWQVPESRELPPWPQLVTDLDGDRLDDLVVPGPGGYTLARQERAASGAVTLVPLGQPHVPADRDDDPAPSVFSMRRGSGGGSSFRIDLGLSGNPDARGPLVDVDDGVPAPVVLDFDGDGRRDLWALERRTLYVWLQDSKGRFSAAPTHSHPLPVAHERRLDLDISYSAHAADLDRDRKGDLVLLAGERGADRSGTQVLVFVQGRGKGAAQQTAQAPLFGPEGIPQQLLVLSGIAGAPRLADVDGDGRLDLMALSFRPDTIDVLKAASSEKLSSEVLVFRNQDGLFARKPDLLRSFEFSAAGGGNRERMRQVPDLDGDGAAELLLRTRADEASLFHFRRRKDALTLEDEPWLRIPLTAEARLFDAPAAGPAPAALLVVDRERIQVVRAR